MQISNTTDIDQGGLRRPLRSSVTACMNCREQKLKCSRDHPTCSRCARSNASCVYPDPPNRRGPRAKRIQRRQLEAVDQSHDDVPPTRAQLASADVAASDHHSSPVGPSHRSAKNTELSNNSAFSNESSVSPVGTFVLSDSYSSQLRHIRAVSVDQSVDQEQPPLPPTALGLSLLEVFFARIYNAHLLFDKAPLFQQYLEGKLHRVLLKALFALATVFLRQAENETERDINKELQVLSGYYSSGILWARAALKEATLLAFESPSLMVIQALQCIQLFLFGIGQPHSGHLCLALAYRSCKLLEYDRKPVDRDNDSYWSFEPELARRCFWACWTSTCIVREPEPYVVSAWEEVAMLPLPRSTSSSFHHVLDRDWHLISEPHLSELAGPPSPLGLLMRMVGAWSRVQLYCKASATERPGGLTTFHDLANLLASIFEAALEARTQFCEDSQTARTQMVTLLHDAIYHQSQITLHSTIVPLFSGNPPNPWVDAEARRKAAEAVINHADRFERLLVPYLYGTSDASRLAPLVGYAAFVVGIVFLSIEVRRHNEATADLPLDTNERGSRLAAVEAILSLLTTLKGYWSALHQPCEVLCTALHASRTALRPQPQATEFGQNNALVPTIGPCSSPLRRTTSKEDNVDNRDPQLPAIHSNTTRRLEEPVVQHSGNDSHGSHVVSRDSLLSSLELLPGFQWYDLSFTEAEVDMFAGLVPSDHFRQGWESFG